jgi:hypothetical protein
MRMKRFAIAVLVVAALCAVNGCQTQTSENGAIRATLESRRHAEHHCHADGYPQRLHQRKPGPCRGGIPSEDRRGTRHRYASSLQFGKERWLLDCPQYAGRRRDDAASRSKPKSASESSHSFRKLAELRFRFESLRHAGPSRLAPRSSRCSAPTTQHAVSRPRHCFRRETALNYGYACCFRRGRDRHRFLHA